MIEANSSIFKNLNSEKTGTAAEKVVKRLQDMIHSGEISAGDRLPPERDLAKMLGVSRPTLRAGIRSLSTVGILQSRHGAGTFVAKAYSSLTLDGSQLRMMATLQGFTSDEMFDAWLALEMSIAGLAAERATSEQMALMAEEITGMNVSLSQHEQFLIHERQFHHIVADASGNSILTSLVNMVATILSESRGKTGKSVLKESAEQYQNIYCTIREGNVESARRSMHDHLVESQNTQRLEEFENADGKS